MGSFWELFGGMNHYDNHGNKIGTVIREFLDEIMTELEATTTFND